MTAHAPLPPPHLPPCPGTSERFASQLSGPTTVFKVESPYYNYYARFFKPYVHYIPVKYDLSDLAQQVS